MTQTSAVGTTTQPAQTSGSTPVNPGGQLGKDDFLKLLVAQLQNQDPTNPTDSSAWMAQLAQYSSLEQMTNVAQSVGQLVTSSSVAQGMNLIGRQITWTRADGTTATGVADGTSLQNGQPALDVNGESVTLDQITAVAQAPTTSSSIEQGVNLIGRQITWTRADGTTATGVADAMSLQNGQPALDVNGESVTLDQITAVALAPTTSSTQTTTTQ